MKLPIVAQIIGLGAILVSATACSQKVMSHQEYERWKERRNQPTTNLPPDHPPIDSASPGMSATRMSAPGAASTGMNATGSSAPEAPQGEHQEGGVIVAGNIQVAPELADKVRSTAVLYVMARYEGSRAPILVQRRAGVRFPFHYHLTVADAMFDEGELEGPVEVLVRLDLDGNAGQPQPGDMEGMHPKSVTSGAEGVDITIDKIH